jgi:hypothetical protein
MPGRALAPPAFDVRPHQAENSLEGWNKTSSTLVCSEKKSLFGVPQKMALTKEDAIRQARTDLVSRIGVKEDEIEQSVEDTEFPDMALGAAAKGEMSGQMLTSGWRINLKAGGKNFEYRANKNQVRLFNYKGSNYRI